VEIPRVALLFSASPSANPAGPRERLLRTCMACAQLGAGVLDGMLATLVRSGREATAPGLPGASGGCRSSGCPVGIRSPGFLPCFGWGARSTCWLSRICSGARRAGTPSRNARTRARRRRLEPSGKDGSRRARYQLAQRTRRRTRGAPGDQALGGNQGRARGPCDPRRRTAVPGGGRRRAEPFGQQGSREGDEHLAQRGCCHR
jgi:hypothetical protein